MRRPFHTTLIALAFASLLALLELFRTSMTRLLDGRPADGFEMLHRTFLIWFTIIVASPWCAFMAARFPLRSGRSGRMLLAHLGGAIVFVALHVTLLIGLHSMIRGTAAPPGGFGLVHLYAFYVLMEMSVYAAIVGVLLFLEERREAAARAIATARLEQSVTAARLESLQAQLRPHFLFNTLNALAVLARRGDAAAVDHAIVDLGDLLRASFDSPALQDIALADELAFLERYLNLQRIRFPGRLVVDWAVADETRHARVPALLVQPLVENAIEHGLETMQGGRVSVAARRDGETLEIVVADDGPGFGTNVDGRPGGVGLANTRERLALLYGAAATLTTGEREGGGGEVRLRIPWRTERAAVSA